jgi:hypothetical protein
MFETIVMNLFTAFKQIDVSGQGGPNKLKSVLATYIFLVSHSPFQALQKQHPEEGRIGRIQVRKCYERKM